MKILIDQNIIDELKNGSVPALERIFNLYSSKLFYFINSYIRNKEISEELTQDVFIRLWENKHNLINSPSINNYLYTIAKNLCIDYIRKKKIHILPIDSIIDESDFSQKNEGDIKISSIEEIDLINKAIERLSPRKQEIFRMHRFDKIAYQQIAEKLGISVSAVEKQISSALTDIQKYLSENK
jgi:RNA polymerase sigma-70 factor, ECF subfamily